MFTPRTRCSGKCGRSSWRPAPPRRSPAAALPPPRPLQRRPSRPLLMPRKREGRQSPTSPRTPAWKRERPRRPSILPPRGPTAAGCIATISQSSGSAGPSARPGEALGEHAVVEDLVGIAGGLLAHRLVFDAKSAAHLPIAPECGVDVLVDPALAGERGIGLLIAVAQLASDRLLVGAGLDPAHRCRRARAGDELQPDKYAGRCAAVTLANDHANIPLYSRSFRRFEQIGELGLERSGFVGGNSIDPAPYLAVDLLGLGFGRPGTSGRHRDPMHVVAVKEPDIDSQPIESDE